MKIVKRYKGPPEDIIIAKYPNGKYYNHYGYKEEIQMGDSIAGGYDSLVEAEYYVRRHGPASFVCNDENPENFKDSYFQNVLEQFLNREDGDDRCACFFDVFQKELLSDDDKYEKKGRYMLQSLTEYNPNNLLISLCGWSAESLLKKAHLIHNDDGVLSEKIVKVTINYSVGNEDYSTTAKVDLETFEVFDFAECLPANLTDLFITFDGEYFFKVIPANSIPNDFDYWYNPDLTKPEDLTQDFNENLYSQIINSSFITALFSSKKRAVFENENKMRIVGWLEDNGNGDQWYILSLEYLKEHCWEESKTFETDEIDLGQVDEALKNLLRCHQENIRNL